MKVKIKNGKHNKSIDYINDADNPLTYESQDNAYGGNERDKEGEGRNQI